MEKIFGNLSQKSIIELNDVLQKLWRIKETYNKQLSFINDAMKEVQLEDKIENCDRLIEDCNQYIKKHKIEVIDKLLHKFNFKTQKVAFDLFWRNKGGKGIGTFLIHGEASSGQPWIYKSLLQRVKIIANKKIIELQKCRRPFGIIGMLEVLSSELGLTLGLLPSNPKIDKIIERCDKLIELIIAKLQKGNIVICFNNAIDFLHQNDKIRHFKSENHLKLFIDLFWIKLSKVISKHPVENKLVIFFIEEKIYKDDFPFFSNLVKDSVEQHLPFQLPPIEDVSETYINDWAKHHVFNSEHVDIFDPIHTYQDLTACEICLQTHQLLSPIDFFHHVHDVCNGHIPYERYY
jgi:hypothetical protein